MAGLSEVHVFAQSNFRILSMIAYLMPHNYQTKVKSKEIKLNDNHLYTDKQMIKQTTSISIGQMK